MIEKICSIRKVDLTSIDIEVLAEFYCVPNNRNTVILVFRQNNLHTVLSISDYWKICESALYQGIDIAIQLKYFLTFENNYCEYDRDEAIRVFHKCSIATHLIKSLDISLGVAEFYIQDDTLETNEIINDIFHELIKSRVNAFRIKIPKLMELAKARAFLKMGRLSEN